ncbi:DUF222 domain-containing protein [Skermania sp. ID1734]|uniref:HNH endonuclease signature motif containing protein n=1 Tax=Skermania sp. ID1734 TaxID=2597516 RepID=UPI00117FD8DF|nr:HNH endonuclease signature motif containing protein [Skermania sp. ID1734]TSE02035.1 DUF222 domain-containing protein [Skermania sp. ID1734]
MMIIDPEQLQQWSLLAVDELTDQQVLNSIAQVTQAQNVLAGVQARLLARVEAAELTAQLGATSTAAWLADSGRVDPAIAKRQVAVARSLQTLPVMAAALQRGEISEAHAEAIVAAISALQRACPAADLGAAEQQLVDVALAGTPAAVCETGRELVLSHAPEREPVAEDPELNRLDYGTGRDGRGKLRADLDKLTFEKLRSVLEPLAAPRPGPDAEPDPRCAAQRRADALADIVDAQLSGRNGGVGRAQVTLVAEANDLVGKATFVDEAGRVKDTRWPFHLSWTGSVSRQVAQMLACDCEVTVVVVDGNRVPLDVGRSERLVTPAIRKALIVREGGCAVPGCGRPPHWTDAHHITHWAEGGHTTLDNMVLLCRAHHRMIHRGTWQVFLGDDGHPWFIPPKTLDPDRKPMPAHNRRRIPGEAA